MDKLMRENTVITDRSLPSWFVEVLACPHCRSDFEFLNPDIICAGCGCRFPQLKQGAIDFLSPDAFENDKSDWKQRQAKMQDYYDKLIESREETIRAYHCDYDNLESFLARYSGRVVDVGGGNGIARHFLPCKVDYLVVDPSLEWLDPRWRGFAEAFPCLNASPYFIRGVAEKLPLADRSFDVALMVCTLNHVSRPALAIRETARVLRPRGMFLAVLEDMEPTWQDLRTGTYPTMNLRQRFEAVGRKLRTVVADWHVEADHIRISESDLQRWATPNLVLLQRRWISIEFQNWFGAYLVYEFRRSG
jgi:SAM-dependent methyltransferase